MLIGSAACTFGFLPYGTDCAASVRQELARNSGCPVFGHAEEEVATRAALADLMRDRTVIAFAHRLSALKDFDRIVVLDDGRSSQDGSPEMLTHNEGSYRELMKKESMSMSMSAAA